MNITYHSWKAYTECPKKFYKQYVRDDPPTEPINEYFTLYGRLTEKFFELYCNIWRFKTPSLSPEAVRRKMIFIYHDILKSSTVNWGAPYCKDSKEEIFEQAHTDICIIMDSPNKNYFFNTKSEVSIGLILKDSHKIKGRLDFLHTSQVGNEDTIFDGKGTNKIGKNISNDQLYFYTFLYYFRFNKLPIALGFFYYRFNTLVPVEMDMDILNDFRARLSLDVKEMVKAEHKPTPSAKSCKYCKYFTGCTEGEQSRVSRKRSSKIDLESNGEIVELGF
jgi:CRISPR/Cas system-associated exonuclease Cas4 (RecB family)